MPDPMRDLAAILRPPVSVRWRIAVVNAVAVVDGETLVSTDVTGAALVATNSDSRFALGDRVLLLQQSAAWVAVARLSGAASSSPPGAVLGWAGGALPAGWVLADGSLLSRAAYPALFAAIGTTYGAGDGSTTFAVPNPTANGVPWMIRAS